MALVALHVHRRLVLSGDDNNNNGVANKSSSCIESSLTSSPPIIVENVLAWCSLLREEISGTSSNGSFQPGSELRLYNAIVFSIAEQATFGEVTDDDDHDDEDNNNANGDRTFGAAKRRPPTWMIAATQLHEVYPSDLPHLPTLSDLLTKYAL